MSIAEIAKDITRFTLQNVNDAISFKPHLCHEVPPRHYDALRQEYISFTGTSIRKNKCKLFYLPTNMSDELQFLSQQTSELVKLPVGQDCGGTVEEGGEMSGAFNGIKTELDESGAEWRFDEGCSGSVARERTVYYKKRLITELDYENVKRVEKACMLISYAAVNQCLQIETCDSASASLNTSGNSLLGYCRGAVDDDDERERNVSTGDEYCGECARRSLERGEMLGFRELGYLINITPWHFHRVFKVIAGLTIREYGQLCCDFLKGQEDILFRVRDKVSLLRANGESFSCLEDEEFMRDDVAAITQDFAAIDGGASAVNIVILPDYFIDPNKSKELKRKLKEQKCNGISPDMGVSKVEMRKRRYSLMSHRIMEASSSSIKNNPTLMDCLENSTLTRGEYERRQKQKHLQRSKLKKRIKSSSSAPSTIRKNPYNRSHTLDAHSMLRNAVVKREGEVAAAAAAAKAAAAAAATVTANGAVAAQEQKHTEMPSTDTSTTENVFGCRAADPSTSSASSTSSGLLSGYDYEQDSQSIGQFSSSTHSVLDFKFSTSMASEEPPSDYTAVLNSLNTPAAAPDVSVCSAAPAPVPTDVFNGGDSYKYNLGVSNLGVSPATSVPLPPAKASTPTVSGTSALYYDASLSAFPVAPDSDGPIGSVAANMPASLTSGPGPSSTNGNYNLTSIMYPGASQQMLDFGPLFGTFPPAPSNPSSSYNPSLGSMEYLISSSAGFFKEDDDGL